MRPKTENPERLLSNPFKLARKFRKKSQSPGGPPKAVQALQAESELGPVLHKEALATLHRLEDADPSLRQVLQQSAGYAVFPRVGSTSALLGGAFGLGEVFVHQQVAGYAALMQLSVGLQLARQTYQELVVFQSQEALEAFKAGKVSFSAHTSAMLVKSGAAATSRRRGTKVFVRPRSGAGVEAGIGGQKFFYAPAAVGRLKSALEPAKAALKSNLSHLGKPTNPLVPPSGGPQVPVRRSSSRPAPSRRPKRQR